jgi:hypothetical protein
MIGAAIGNARRWGTIGVFRLASTILRYATTLAGSAGFHIAVFELSYQE